MLQEWYDQNRVLLISKSLIMGVIGITGGTGLIGRHIVPLLTEQGHNVIIFSRNPERNTKTAQVCYALYDAANNRIDTAAIGSIDAMLHLAGESVAAKRWTPQQKQEILNSRVQGTRMLTDALAAHAPNCKVFIASSAIGYYGPDTVPAKPFEEDSKPATDFLGDTCRQWEAAIATAPAHIRTVLLRTGIVLAKEGGAFPEYIKAMPVRVLPVIGNGKQIVSWIHVADMARMFVYALHTQTMQGAYNAVAPRPASCTALMHAIGAASGKTMFYPNVPAGILKIMLGEMSIEVLKSCTVSAQKILEQGFKFQYPSVDEACVQLLSA